LTLLERKELLKGLLPDSEHIQFCDHVNAMGITVYEKAVALGMEGVIAKKSNSTYDPNIRTSNWLKFKKIEDTEAIICGYTLSKTKSRKFSSLILGMVEDDELVYVGTCGTGFSEKQINDLYYKFEILKTDTPVFEINKYLKGREAVWIQPKLVCEVRFSEWTPSNIMRHPVFLRLKEDKSIVFDALQNPKPLKQTKASSSEFSLEVDGIQVQITNSDKVYWPNSKLTKYDLLDYYIKMSEYILPYLKDRPESLHRHPNGIQGDSFYQKDHENLPSWIETVAIASKSS